MSDLLDAFKAVATNTPGGLIMSTVSNVLDRFLPQDPAARQAAALELARLQAEGTFEQKADLQTQTAQIAVNQAEAAQPGAHFRDGAGWVCVAAFGLIVLRPLVEWGSILAGHPVTLPAVDTSETNTVLWGLLGLGGYHAAPAVIGAFRGNQ